MRVGYRRVGLESILLQLMARALWLSFRLSQAIVKFELLARGFCNRSAKLDIEACSYRRRALAEFPDSSALTAASNTFCELFIIDHLDGR